MSNEEDSFRKLGILLIFLALLTLSFFLVRPILFSIVVGAILAFIFNPPYKFLYSKIKSKNLSIVILGIFLLIILIMVFWFGTPIILRQSLEVYEGIQNINFVTPLKSIFPSIFNSDEFANDVGSILYSFVIRTTNSFTSSLTSLILNFPTLFMHAIVTIFVFFFLLKDQELVLAYLKSLSPFSKEFDKKFFNYSKDITYSVLYGQVIIGILQGIISGAGFFIFGVPNSFLLTFFALVAGILPIIGPALVWVPVAVYLFSMGETFSGFGIILFGLVSSVSEQLLRPLIVSHRTSMNSAVILAGMVGGFFFLGVLGALIGPLILAYLFLLLDLYRDKKSSVGVIQEVQ